MYKGTWLYVINSGSCVTLMTIGLGVWYPERYLEKAANSPNNNLNSRSIVIEQH